MVIGFLLLRFPSNLARRSILSSSIMRTTKLSSCTSRTPTRKSLSPQTFRATKTWFLTKSFLCSNTSPSFVTLTRRRNKCSSPTFTCNGKATLRRSKIRSGRDTPRFLLATVLWKSKAQAQSNSLGKPNY